MNLRVGSAALMSSLRGGHRAALNCPKVTAGTGVLVRASTGKLSPQAAKGGYLKAETVALSALAWVSVPPTGIAAPRVVPTVMVSKVAGVVSMAVMA